MRLTKVEDHKMALGKCYRCKTVVEPYLSPQWFVKIKPLAEPAIKAVEDGRIASFLKDGRTTISAGCGTSKTGVSHAKYGGGTKFLLGTVENATPDFIFEPNP